MTAPVNNSFDAIVLGAGGAGLMCAGTAGQRGRRILVLDHADKPGKKILISGGGRCNFTNTGTVPERFISANRHFAKSALRRYTPANFIALVDQHGIAWHEKTLGQLFCDGSARQIVKMLLDECPSEQVRIELGQPVHEVAHDGSEFRVRFGAETYRAPKLVIATGGPSIPKMGATGFAFDLARQFGLAIETPRPALVPLTLSAQSNPFHDLAGVAAPVTAACERIRFREAALFTHRGLSGPSILQISSYWSPGKDITIDFLPDQHEGWLLQCKREQPSQQAARLLAGLLPRRLAAVLGQSLELDVELGNATDKHLARAERQLAAWAFRPNGTEGYAKAEVTAGGISTADLSSQTMMAKPVAGLYAIGEAVDVTGWLGGYNFQWAWASGRAAGEDL